MPTLVSCPGCGVSGELPDDVSGGLLGCPRCGAHFTPGAARKPDGPVAAEEVVGGMSVWVGSVPTDDTPPPQRGLSVRAPHVVQPPRTAEGRPIEVTEENAAAHLDWLQQEVWRFNDFVAAQFEQIQRAREEAARAAARAGAAIVTHEQELNRERATMAARTAAHEATLARREEELAARRAELERRLADVARAEEDLRRRADEADEIEDALRTELEEREREIESRHRVVEEEARQFRNRTPATPGSARPTCPVSDPAASPGVPSGPLPSRLRGGGRRLGSRDLVGL